MAAEYPCDYYIQQAHLIGVTDEQIAAFKAGNTNPDGTWDCHRLLSAFGGIREQTQSGVSSAAVAAAAALPPPIMPMGTTGGIPQYGNLPTVSGGGSPARELAPIVASGSPFSFLSFTTPTGQIDFVKIAILAALAFAAWHFIKK